MGDRNINGNKLNPLFHKWNTEFDELDARIRSAGSDPKADSQKQIAGLRPTYRYKEKANHEEIQKDIENAWKDLKHGLQKHMDCL